MDQKEVDRALFGFMTRPDGVQPIADALNPLVQAVETRLEFSHRETAVTEALQAKWGPQDTWRRADDPERDIDRRAAHDVYAQTSGEDLFRLDHTTYRHRQELETIVARAAEPPDAVQAWAQRAKTTPDQIPTAEALSLRILDELLQARFDRELSPLQPSQVQAAYQRALADPLEPGNASLIRHVEARHHQGWRGVIVTRQEAEAMSSTTLLQTIAAARAARIPAAVKEVQALMAKAEGLVQKAMIDGHIRPQRPSGWRVA